tara:strand:- start:2910 stop:3620 length:711 start_codon:yes stop_codon:yes gene_type:complete
MAYMDILPDPTNKILDSGLASGSGTAGPGFASVKFTSEQPTIVDRTHSGRVITRAIAGQFWKVGITYNPLTRAEFDPVNSFLMAMQGSLKPFFVMLPQYSAFNADNTDNAVQAADGSAVAAGKTYMKITYSGAGTPQPGDIFNIIDSNNSNHLKTYMVTRYETDSSYSAIPGEANLTSGEKRLSFNPPLQYEVSNGAELEFTNPKIRVINKSRVQEYSLNTDSLYKFNLNLEEALP